MSSSAPRRLVVAITGASGAIYGVRLLEHLRALHAVETHLAHIRNMESVTLMGGVIFPPVPAFYQRPRSIDEMVDQTIARVLDQFEIAHELAPPWPGIKPALD